MRKTTQVFIMFLLVFLIGLMLTSFCSYAFDITKITEGMKDSSDQHVDGQDDILQAGATIVGAVKYVGTILAVLLIVWFGIQWMTANAQKKAQLQDQAWNYVIGSILLFGSGQIAQWVYNMVKSGVGA